jgi:hypothetical protein
VNPARQRAIMAAQKIRRVDDPDLIAGAMKLTPAERKAIYAPKAASSAPQHLQGSEWVRAWRMVSRITYGLTAFTGLIVGGIIAGESKKGIKG